MRNRNHNLGVDGGYAVYPNYDASPDSLIDSKLKHEIDLRSMIKLKTFKKTVTYIEAANNNTSHNWTNNAPHAPNATTVPDAEIKTFMRQLLDGQEYTVTKADNIKKEFYCKAAVEWCMA